MANRDAEGRGATGATIYGTTEYCRKTGKNSSQKYYLSLVASSPGGGAGRVHNLEMDRGLPPDFQKGTLF